MRIGTRAISGLNPLVPGGDNFTNRLLGEAIHAGAYAVDPSTLDLVADLAESLPTVRNGGVVVHDDGTMDVTWTVREGASWSDGEPVAADDFAFTIEAITEQSRRFPLDAAMTEAFGLVRDVAVDGREITVTFASATLTYETLFEVVLPRHAVEGTDLATDWEERTWPSAGPFTVAEYVANERLLLQRNPFYDRTDAYGIALPYLDEVEFVFVDDDEYLDAWLSGAVDVIPVLTADDIATAVATGVDVIRTTGWLEHNLFFMFAPEGGGSEQNGVEAYRQAVAHLIDRAGLAEALVGAGVPPAAAFLEPRSVEGPWSELEPDPVRGAELIGHVCTALERDCVAEPLEAFVGSGAPRSHREAELIAEMLTGVPGLEVTISNFNSATAFCGPGGCGFDLSPGGGFESTTAAELADAISRWDPDQPTRFGERGRNWVDWGIVGSRNEGDPSTEAMRAVIAELDVTADVDRVRELAAEADRILADDMAVIPLFVEPIYIVLPGGLSGIGAADFRSIFTGNIEHWWWEG